MPAVDTGMHLRSSTTQFPTLVLEKPAVQRCAASGLFYMSSQIPHEPHWYRVQHTVTNDLQRFCPSCSTPDAARLRRGGSLSSEAPPVFSVAGTWEVRSGRLVYCSSGLLFAVLKYLNSQEAAVTQLWLESTVLVLLPPPPFSLGLVHCTLKL